MTNRRSFLTTCTTFAVGAMLGGRFVRSTESVSAATRANDLVRFGQTELFVTRYCQGTAFREVERSDNPAAQAILHKCLDVGINFFDSSEAYGWDGAEIVLGKVLTDRRDQVVICTKATPSWKPEFDAGTNQFKLGEACTFTRETMVRKVEGSLKRLGTDYIDLYLFHSPDETTPMEEQAAAMDDLVRAGKIRYWGCSNYTPTQIAAFAGAGRKNSGSSAIAGTEDYFHIAIGERLDADLLPTIAENQLGLLAFSPQNEGQLSPGRRSNLGKAKTPVVRALDKVAAEIGATRPQVCIAWVLSHPEVTSVLGGAESPGHVVDNFGGVGLELPAEALTTLNAASEKYREHRLQRVKEEADGK